MKQYQDFKTLSQLAKTAKFNRKVLKAARIAAEKEIAEMNFWMRLTK